jgi:hypothetical protein
MPHSTKFGEFYEIRGALTGPDGVTLRVRSIWIKEHFVWRHKIHDFNPRNIIHRAL